MKPDRQQRAADKRRRAAASRLVAQHIAHANQVRTAIANAITRGERDPETGASMLRSIDNKIRRWRTEREELAR